jgi:hypothetical protein
MIVLYAFYHYLPWNRDKLSGHAAVRQFAPAAPLNIGYRAIEVPLALFAEPTPPAKKFVKMLEKWVEDNDADATYQLRSFYFNGEEGLGITKDLGKAVKLFHRAAELGSADHVEANYHLGVVYYNGISVSKDETKAKPYFEKAAMAGCIRSRFFLSCVEFDAGSFDRATKHWLIAASCGEIGAVDCIKRAMNIGEATKDHYAQALRGYLLWRDEVKSDHRIRAAAYSDDYDFF